MRELTEGKFLKDVAEHTMHIAIDNGNHRHVTFAKPGTWCMSFQLITWPGYLCYTGDMGTFVFRRLDDMFEFFRDHKDEGKLRINLGYWAEKLEATDRGSGHEQWSEDKFRAVIEGYFEDEPPSPELRQAIDEEVLSRIDDGQHEAYRAANDFEHDGFTFTDLWDHDFTEYSYRFIWCCYALAWGIKQYDESMTSSMMIGRMG